MGLALFCSCLLDIFSPDVATATKIGGVYSGTCQTRPESAMYIV